MGASPGPGWDRNDPVLSCELLPSGRKGCEGGQGSHEPTQHQLALYAQGVKIGPNIYVSGMVGIDPATGQLAGSTIQEQTRQALVNCSAILEAGGARLDDVAEVGVLLTSPTTSRA